MTNRLASDFTILTRFRTFAIDCEAFSSIAAEQFSTTKCRIRKVVAVFSELESCET
ncbi:hypothetical protein HMPREF0307_00071 [Corynebacterium sp. DNF00584]|nr:hypothetical protein HMPREF0307_00071 [Corynebacterium sp. DNF00584]